MTRHRMLLGVGCGALAAILQVVAGNAHGTEIRLLQCQNEAAGSASELVDGVCKTQAAARPSSKLAVYLVTLSHEESLGGTREAIRIAERETRRKGFCRSGVVVLAGPTLAVNSGRTELAVRCYATKAGG